MKIYIGKLWSVPLFTALVVFSFNVHATEIKAQAGQPFCQQFDDLQPYLMALIQKNIDEAHRYDCGGLTKGTRLSILEDIPSQSEIGHVARVRAFLLGGGGSLVGYTLIMMP